MQTNRQTAINSLAVVGFIALLSLGVWGAVYSARFVPSVVNKIGAAAVYLGAAFSPSGDPDADLTVVPAATSTVISFGDAPAATSTAPQATTTPVVPKPVAVSPGPRQDTVVSTGGTVAPATYGLPDLAVTVTQIGYLNSNSTDSFVGSQTVPDGKRPAVKFSIKNIGTEWSGTWRFNAEIPTRRSYTFKSDTQQSLAPGESISYVLGFDQARSGDNRTVTITANYDGTVIESSTANNTVDIKLDIE